MRRRQVRPGVRGRKPTCARQGRRAGSEGVAGAGPGPLLRCARQGGARRQVTRRPPRSPPAAPGCPRVYPPPRTPSPLPLPPLPLPAPSLLSRCFVFRSGPAGLSQPKLSRPLPVFPPLTRGLPSPVGTRCAAHQLPVPEPGRRRPFRRGDRAGAALVETQGLRGAADRVGTGDGPPRLSRPDT